MQAEDPHRDITAEHDLTDLEEQRTRDQHTARRPRRRGRRETAAEPAPRDIRQEAADEPARDDDQDTDVVRVPSADETAESVRRAHRALDELKQRKAIEDRRAADEARARDDEVARWHSDDHGADATDDAATADRPTGRADRSGIDDAPVLEVTPVDY